MDKIIVDGKEVNATGALSPFRYLSTIEKSTVTRFVEYSFNYENDHVAIWYQEKNTGIRNHAARIEVQGR